MQTYTLANGVSIPSIGFGTFKIVGQDVYKPVLEALEAGYRHIDTASMYGNEKEIGQAIKDSGIDRRDIFITSKIWRTDRGYDKTIASFNRSLEYLGTDYLDCLLIHWPCPINKENYNEVNIDTWKALIDLYKAKKVRVIGVSNFLCHHIEPLLECEIKPMINQLELHPGFRQEEIVDLCRKEGILLEAWEPLAKAKILDDERIVGLAHKYHKSPAQICIRWSLDNGFLPLPKSVTPSRIKENLDVFDFTLDREDIELINGFEFIGGSKINPDEVEP